MGLEFFDSSPDSAEVQHIRLAPARAVTGAGIPCLVWAEDALSSVHFVPTCLFSLQLLVPDEHLEDAASAILSKLPYKRYNEKEPPVHWKDYRAADKEERSCFPGSIYFQITKPTHQRSEDDPEDIYLHPMSYFSFDVRDHSLSVTLVPPLPQENSEIRFPTRAAFLDSLIQTIHEPPLGYRHWQLSMSLKVYVGYLITYTLRADPRVLPTGELEAEHASAVASLREENRPFFEALIRGTSKGWSSDLLIRRAALERMGRAEEARRPVPSMTARIHFGQVRSFHTISNQVAPSPGGIGYLRDRLYTPKGVFGRSLWSISRAGANAIPHLAPPLQHMRRLLRA